MTRRAPLKDSKDLPKDGKRGKDGLPGPQGIQGIQGIQGPAGAGITASTISWSSSFTNNNVTGISLGTITLGVGTYVIQGAMTAFGSGNTNAHQFSIDGTANQFISCYFVVRIQTSATASQSSFSNNLNQWTLGTTGTGVTRPILIDGRLNIITGTYTLDFRLRSEEAGNTVNVNSGHLTFIKII